MRSKVATAVCVSNWKQIYTQKIDCTKFFLKKSHKIAKKNHKNRLLAFLVDGISKLSREKWGFFWIKNKE